MGPVKNFRMVSILWCLKERVYVYDKFMVQFYQLAKISWFCCRFVVLTLWIWKFSTTVNWIYTPVSGYLLRIFLPLRITWNNWEVKSLVNFFQWGGVFIESMTQGCRKGLRRQKKFYCILWQFEHIQRASAPLFDCRYVW